MHFYTKQYLWYFGCVVTLHDDLCIDYNSEQTVSKLWEVGKQEKDFPLY